MASGAAEKTQKYCTPIRLYQNTKKTQTSITRLSPMRATVSAASKHSVNTPLGLHRSFGSRIRVSGSGG